MTAIEETPELTADLPDVLGMVAALATLKRLGADWRRKALAISNAGADLERMSGLVIDGETYTLGTSRQEWAACGCRNGLHEFTRDQPYFGRGYWQDTRTDAEELVARVHGHLVTRLVATTPLEVRS